MNNDSRACPECGEPMKNIDYDENDDRIRTRDCCPTHGEHDGCFAKRLAERSSFVEGYTGALEAWGPVGVWHFSKAVS